jgi:hypothetical protein
MKWVVDDVYGKFSAIDKEDVQIFNLVDSAEEAMEIIHRSKPRNEFN